MTDNIKKRIAWLRREIERHNKLYYAKDRPEISDEAYDKLMKELERLEAAHPEYASPDSPTRKVGGAVRTGYAKVRHASPMLSLDNINKEDEAEHFDEVCKKELGVDGLDYMCEPKLDGLSVELVYENGVFRGGSTRGDGVIGEDVTENLRTIENIPSRLKGEKLPKKLVVRGEVLMHIKDFHELNKKQTETGLDTFANPRNAAAGSLRQLDSRKTRVRKLDIFCYEIMDYSEKIPASHKEVVELIKKYGLRTVPDSVFCHSIKEAVKYHREMEKRRDELDYEIDGVVIKVNNIEYNKKLGMRTNNPRWAVAYKFEGRKGITRVEDIVVQVGRTGVLTPVALFQPVEVGGVTVSRATLHNMDEVERLGVKIGDHVKVERAGDVIPHVTEVIRSKRTGKEKEFHMPKACPGCGSQVEKEDVFYRCPAGMACPAQLKETMIHYASKGAVDIDGLSDKTVELLYGEGAIKSISDIYNLKKEDLLRLEGWKEKRTANLLDAIERSKDVALDRFIFGLGIRNVGSHIASLLASRFGSLDKLMAASEADLEAIKEIGPETAVSIVDFFKEKRNIHEIEKLIKAGVKPRRKTVTGKLAGKKIVFTGSLKTMTRSEAQRRVREEGGEAQSGVSADTDFVVAGEDAGSKLAAAKKKNIPILTEEEFLRLL